jgi:hypothetical protein
MIIAALFLAALSVEAQVFPDRMCENLPEVSPEVKACVAQFAPELAQVSVRELAEKTALGIFARAAAAGWGSVDVLTNSVFREPCTFYFSGEALRAVDAAFVLDLVTEIRGQDKRRQDFEMTALLAGRGKLVVLYDRDGLSTGTRGWPATSGSPPGSYSKRRLLVCSKMSRDSAPRSGC